MDNLKITDLVHFNAEGWCILANIIDEKDGIIYKFFTLTFFGDEPRTIYLPKKNYGKNPTDKCQVRYFEKEDIAAMRRGDEIFYFANEKQISGNKRAGGQVLHGSITSFNIDTGNVVIDHNYTVKIYTLLAFEHNFELIKDTDAYICGYCQALHTEKYKEKVV